MSEANRIRIVEGTQHGVKRRVLRAVALFEAIKGVAALALIIGVLELMHRDVRHLAIELIGHFNFNPNAHYASILLHYADLLPGADVRALALLAFAYILVRLLEAYGLWNDLTWGEWLGALSGGIYIPFEIGHFAHRPTSIGAMVLAGNVFVVSFLAFQLWRGRKNDGARQ